MAVLRAIETMHPIVEVLIVSCESLSKSIEIKELLFLVFIRAKINILRASFRVIETLTSFDSYDTIQGVNLNCDRNFQIHQNQCLQDCPHPKSSSELMI